MAPVRVKVTDSTKPAAGRKDPGVSVGARLASRRHGLVMAPRSDLLAESGLSRDRPKAKSWMSKRASRGNVELKGQPKRASYAEIVGKAKAPEAEHCSTEVQEACMNLKAMLWAGNEAEMSYCKPLVVTRNMYAQKCVLIKYLEASGADRFWMSLALLSQHTNKNLSELKFRLGRCELKQTVQLSEAVAFARTYDLSVYLDGGENSGFEIVHSGPNRRGLAGFVSGKRLVWSPVLEVSKSRAQLVQSEVVEAAAGHATSSSAVVARERTPAVAPEEVVAESGRPPTAQAGRMVIRARAGTLARLAICRVSASCRQEQQLVVTNWCVQRRAHYACTRPVVGPSFGVGTDSIGSVKVVRGVQMPPIELSNFKWIRPERCLQGHPRAVVCGDSAASPWNWKERMFGVRHTGRVMLELSDGILGQNLCEGTLVYSALAAEHPSSVGMFANGCYNHDCIEALYCDRATYGLRPVLRTATHQVSAVELRVREFGCFGTVSPPNWVKRAHPLSRVASLGLLHQEMRLETQSLSCFPNQISKTRAITTVCLPLVDKSLHGPIHDLKMEVIGEGCKIDILPAMKQLCELGRQVNRAGGSSQFSLK